MINFLKFCPQIKSPKILLKIMTGKSSNYSETEFILEKPSDECAVRVHFNTIPARVRDHDGGNPLPNRVVVGWHVNAEHIVAVYNRIVLVHPFVRSTVPYKVLRACCNLIPTYILLNTRIQH